MILGRGVVDLLDLEVGPHVPLPDGEALQGHGRGLGPLRVRRVPTAEIVKVTRNGGHSIIHGFGENLLLVRCGRAKGWGESEARRSPLNAYMQSGDYF